MASIALLLTFCATYFYFQDVVQHSATRTNNVLTSYFGANRSYSSIEPHSHTNCPSLQLASSALENNKVTTQLVPLMKTNYIKTFSIDQWRSSAFPAPVVLKSEVVRRAVDQSQSPGAWYTHKNVCVNSEDGSTRFPEAVSAEYVEISERLGLFNASIPFAPKPVNFTAIDEPGRAVHHLPGVTIIAQCWRSSGPNPYHYMFAMGKLFTLLHSSKPFRVDHVVLHQCPNPNQLPDFHKVVWKFIFDLGIRNGFFNVETSVHSLSGKTESGMDFFCMDHAEVAYSFWFIGSQGAPFAQAFRPFLWRYIDPELTSQSPRQTGLSPQLSQTDGSQCDACVKALRFGLYKRPSSDHNQRKITNDEEVFELFREFSRNVVVVSVSSVSSLEELYDQFNSFDVIVNSVGSHAMNFLLTDSSRYAVIDVWALEIENLSETVQDFVPYYAVSYPHLPEDPVLQQTAKTVVGSVHNTELHYDFMNANLIIDIPRLRGELQKAVAFVCNCSGTVEI